MSERARVLQVIARLNVGGPAIHVITLTRRLEERGFDTLLVRGVEAEREGTMDDLADQLNVVPRRLTTLGRELDPVNDLCAILALRRIIRRERPDVLHTHTAKAGAAGRVAALLAGRQRPHLVVHTFHGHILAGYFSPRKERFFGAIEGLLARGTDVMIAVSDEVRRDLLERGIGRPDQIRVVPLGFDLDRFDLSGDERATARFEMRRNLGVPESAFLVTIAARLVPIKRIDIFLAAAATLARERADVWFCIAGDGELHDRLRASAAARALDGVARWPGFIRDMPALYAASDLVMLTSDNEGTPVSLIEALATTVPVVATDVGGVPTIVRHERTGLLAPHGDPVALGEAALRMANDRDLAKRTARDGREDVRARFGIARLVDEIVDLYEDGLRAARP